MCLRGLRLECYDPGDLVGVCSGALGELVTSMAVKLGLIGCGSIGTPVLAAIDTGRAPGVRCEAVLVRQARSGAEADPRITCDGDSFFRHDFNLVVECAGHAALRQYGGQVLSRGQDLMVVSMGALADPVLFEGMERQAAASGARLIILSAAIGALDVLTAAAEAGLDAVQIVVGSPPETLRRSPAAEQVDLDRMAMPVCVYSGAVREGARLYPDNANIAAAVALAGLGLDDTQLEIVADPTLDAYHVEISGSGGFGQFRFEEDLCIDATSPTKIAHLLPAAVIKSIRQYAAPVVVGG